MMLDDFIKEQANQGIRIRFFYEKDFTDKMIFKVRFSNRYDFHMQIEMPNELLTSEEKLVEYLKFLVEEFHRKEKEKGYGYELP